MKKTHGITWHLITDGAATGDIIWQSRFDIAPDETALTLNTKCYAAAIDSFSAVMGLLVDGAPSTTKQDLNEGSFFSWDAAPAANGRLDFNQAAETLSALVRGLDHGDYWNPLCCPKIKIGGALWLIQKATAGPSASGSAPGTVIAAARSSLTVATATEDITLSDIKDIFGNSADVSTVGPIR